VTDSQTAHFLQKDFEYILQIQASTQFSKVKKTHSCRFESLSEKAIVF
jgi:hypothetical protein